MLRLLRFRTLAIASIIIVVSPAHSATVPGKCQDAIHDCTTMAVAGHDCRSAWWSILLDSARTDHNNDCAVTKSDIQAGFNEDYDKDGDGQVCASEWISHRTTDLGFTKEFSDWHWGLISTGDCAPLANWTLANYFDSRFGNDVTSVDLKIDFVDDLVQLLVRFCSDNEDGLMSSNRDCLALAVLCREIRPRLAACQRTDIPLMTLYEKLLYSQRSRDLNRDGVISSEEMKSLLRNDFDNNTDHCISQAEWTYRLTRADHFSQPLAQAEFVSVGGGESAEQCVMIDDIASLYDNLGIFSAVEALLSRIIALCDADPQLYESVEECAQVAYTCVTHFGDVPACKGRVDRCGLTNLRKCVDQQTSDKCAESVGQLAVAQEIARLDNQINDICDPWPVYMRDDPVSPDCRTAMATCSERALTSGRCSNFWESLQIDMIRRDVSNDCADDRNDVIFDLRNNYDTDGDGSVCEEEYQARKATHLGYSTGLTRWIWQEAHFSHECPSIEAFYSGIGKSEGLANVYRDTAVQQLLNFCESQEGNMEEERDCFSLPTVCTNRLPDLPACLEFRRKVTMTLKEKLFLEALSADTDGDGLITEAEMDEVLQSDFDADEDGCVSLEEWLSLWSGLYRLSEQFGQFQYRQLVRTGDCLKTGDLRLPSEGIAVTERAGALLEVLITMCERDTTLYEMLPDCVQVSETCLNYFSELPACKPYTDNCGIAQYVACIDDLTDNACASTVDQWECRNEAARAWNQVKVNCKAQSILANFTVLKSGGNSLDATAFLHWLFLALSMIIKAHKYQ